MLALADVFRALKQQVLEEMSKAGAARIFVARADIVGHANRKSRRARVFREQHAQAIFEFEFVESDIVESRGDSTSSCGGSGWRLPLGLLGLVPREFPVRRRSRMKQSKRHPARVDPYGSEPCKKLRLTY